MCAPLLFNYDIYSAMPSKLTYRTLNACNATALGLEPLKMWSRLNKVIKEDLKQCASSPPHRRQPTFGHREDIVIAMTWI